MLGDRVEDALRARIDDATCGAPESLAAAMRHAALEGGARLRPRVCIAVALALGDPAPWLTDAAACSVELIHAASLAHDDLPCFDDSDLRRGRPSLHRLFGVPVALLAGDALIVLAFQVLGREAEGRRAKSAPLCAISRRAQESRAASQLGRLRRCRPANRPFACERRPRSSRLQPPPAQSPPGGIPCPGWRWAGFWERLSRWPTTSAM